MVVVAGCRNAQMGVAWNPTSDGLCIGWTGIEAQRAVWAVREAQLAQGVRMGPN
jgi:hypothetical protein